MKKKHPKLDPYLISRQKWELSYVVRKISSEYLSGYEIYIEDVLAAIKAVGRSRKKVYNWLRKNC